MTSNKYHHGDLKNALIQAGVEILANEGVGGLSLRKVAKKAGVSHSAPYAHFSDKQALLAAISTEGHVRINKKISIIVEHFLDDPLRQLVEAAWTYLDFGLDDPDLFRITFSGVVEREQDYPALVEMTRKNFQLIRSIVAQCQSIGVFGSGDEDMLALSVWGTVHGLVSLIQQGQVSRAVLNRYTPRQLILFTLDRITQVRIDPQAFPLSPGVQVKSHQAMTKSDHTRTK